MSVGQTLAAARAEAGLSVEEVSATTRMRQTIVRAIEQDDYSLCGGDFYARGHIRNLAHAVGIDPAPLLAEFDAAAGGSAGPRPTEVFESETNARPERRGPNWSAAMAVALAVVLGYGAVQAFAGPEGDRRRDGTAQATPSGPAQPETESSPSPTSSGRPDDGIVAQRNDVTVRLRIVGGNSWVNVTDRGGKTLYQGVLQSGAQRQFKDKKRIRLVVGNAGAVRLVVNGQSIGAPGGPGEVMTLEFGPHDPQGSAG